MTISWKLPSSHRRYFGCMYTFISHKSPTGNRINQKPCTSFLCALRGALAAAGENRKPLSQNRAFSLHETLFFSTRRTLHAQTYNFLPVFVRVQSSFCFRPCSRRGVCIFICVVCFFFILCYYTCAPWIVHLFLMSLHMSKDAPALFAPPILPCAGAIWDRWEISVVPPPPTWYFMRFAGVFTPPAEPASYCMVHAPVPVSVTSRFNFRSFRALRNKGRHNASVNTFVKKCMFCLGFVHMSAAPPHRILFIIRT